MIVDCSDGSDEDHCNRILSTGMLLKLVLFLTLSVAILECVFEAMQIGSQ